MTEHVDTSDYAEVNDTKLYYEISGSQHEPTMVMLHAGICDSRMWKKQVSHFAKTYKVITFDMRGFGKSETGNKEFSLHGDLKTLLELLNIENAILMGCSQGGKVTIDFTLTHPDMVSALVLVCPAIGGYRFEGDPHPLMDKLIEADDAGDLEAISELEVQMWVDGTGRKPEDVDSDVRQLVYEMNLRALQTDEAVWDREEALEPPALERLETITQKTIVIQGELDLKPSLERANILSERLPNVRKVMMADTAHLPNMEFPEKFNQIVDEFLATI